VDVVIAVRRADGKFLQDVIALRRETSEIVHVHEVEKCLLAAADHHARARDRE